MLLITDLELYVINHGFRIICYYSLMALQIYRKRSRISFASQITRTRSYIKAFESYQRIPSRYNRPCNLALENEAWALGAGSPYSSC